MLLVAAIRDSVTKRPLTVIFLTAARSGPDLHWARPRRFAGRANLVETDTSMQSAYDARQFMAIRLLPGRKPVFSVMMDGV